MNSNKFIVFLSGKGSNLLAICKNGLTEYISCVISNRKDALGLCVAEEYGIPAYVVVGNNFEMQANAIISKFEHDFIILAGFMSILSASFVQRYTIINIHPSLLPSFIGLHAWKQAVDYGVKIAGSTVHFVIPKLDAGPIIAQGVVPVANILDHKLLHQKILELEHIMYPFIIRKYLSGAISISGGKVSVKYAIEDRKLLYEYADYIFY